MFKYLLLVLTFFTSINAHSQDFDIVSKGKTVSIFYNKGDDKLDSIIAHLLAKDIERVSGVKPAVFTDEVNLKGDVILLGKVGNSYASQFYDFGVEEFKNQRELFSWTFLKNPNKEIKNALVITGSDARGLAYGVFKLSEQIGVSPWYWWADVVPEKRRELSVPAQNFLSKAPSVKYRGIFINDEDWGLRPWASTNYEPQLGNIGPKTYEQVFELLLRLKSNMIWPAMHPGTKAFFNVSGNLEMARKYHIIIGTSHAEPMLRNNVDEWNEKTMGPFNYLINKDKVLDYWDSRIKQSAKNEVIYSMGMRGVHDSGMEGVKSNKEAVPVLEQVMNDQQTLLSHDLDRSDIPQALTLYKEVLDIYDEGLKVPNNITLVWPDDNYGYLRRLNSTEENKRSGGSGVYYHTSYWGRPHDYLWLSTTHPALMREEMLKAWNNNAKDIWVLNVGDIKPAEYQTQLFMDMAWDIHPFQKDEYIKTHLENWYEKAFGNRNAKEISSVIWAFDSLANQRKPEFMGWSQTEPTTKTQLTKFNHFNYGDEGQQRINAYSSLEEKVKLLKLKIPRNLQDAFFELVEYPVMGASQMNKKFLYHDKAEMYAKEERLSSKDYVDSVDIAYQKIKELTQYYNNKLARGKWKGVMSMAPRNLPVFSKLSSDIKWKQAAENWGVDVEGIDSLNFPFFYKGDQQKHFVDIYLKNPKDLNWQISADKAFVQFSKTSGSLIENGLHQERVWLSLKDDLIGKDTIANIAIKTNQGIKTLKLKINQAYADDEKTFKEMNGYVSIFAENYSDLKEGSNIKWEIKDGLGYTGKVMNVKIGTAEKSLSQDSAILKYNFITITAASPKIHVFAVPVHPLNKNFGLICKVRIDDGEWKVIDFETSGRSNEWKENVLSNSSEKLVTFKTLKPGIHSLEIEAIDPGLMLDRFLIDLGGLHPIYGVLKETR